MFLGLQARDDVGADSAVRYAHVSDDGSTVVATARGLGLTGIQSEVGSINTRALRWTAWGGLLDLGSVDRLPVYAAATAVSADGRVVVGQSGTASGYFQAFYWRPEYGMENLGSLGGPGNPASRPR